MKQINAVIQQFVHTLKKYEEQKYENNGTKIIRPFLEIINFINELLSGGALQFLLNIVNSQLKSDEEKKNHTVIEKLNSLTSDFISRLYVASDILPDDNTQKDDLSSLLKIIIRGFDDLIEAIQNEDSLVIISVRKTLLESIAEFKNIFHVLILMRAHNLDQLEFITLTSNINACYCNICYDKESITDNKFKMRIISILQSIDKIISEKKQPFYFQFYNSENSLQLISAETYFPKLKHVIENIDEESKNQLLTSTHKFENYYKEQVFFVTGLQEVVNKWQKIIIKKITSLHKNIELGISENCNVKFNTENNQKVQNTHVALSTKLSTLLALFSSLKSLPLFGSDKVDLIFYNYFTYNIVKEDVKTVDEYLAFSYEQALDKKHPISGMYRQVFAQNFKEKESEELKTYIIKKIHENFAVPFEQKQEVREDQVIGMKN